MTRNITHTMKTNLIAALGESLAITIIKGIMNGYLSGTSASFAASLVSNTQPQYVTDVDYKEAIYGAIVTHLTIQAVQHFWEVTLVFRPKPVNALQEEGITHPKDLALFSSIEFDSLIRSVKIGTASTTGTAS